MSVNYAAREFKNTNLASDFAKQFVTRHFGELATEKIYAALPLFKRGRFKGQPKGWLLWTKCTKGGWVRMGSYDHDAGRGNGFVMQPGTHDVRICLVNPAFTSDLSTTYCLESGQRREAETDQEWADRCGLAITQMAASSK